MQVLAEVNRIVPLRFRDRTLDTYHAENASQRAALKAARRIVDGTLQNLVLVGATGLGKTHLAAGVVAKIVANHEAMFSEAVKAADMNTAPRLFPKPMWLNVADAVATMRFEMGHPSDDRAMTDNVRRVRSHPCLVVLDDLGREKVSDWTAELIYAVVNARYEAMLPTMITSNLSPAELLASPYWTAISRLAEDGEMVKLEGIDHRLKRG